MKAYNATRIFHQNRCEKQASGVDKAIRATFDEAEDELKKEADVILQHRIVFCFSFPGRVYL